MQASYTTSAIKPEQLPPVDVPEIALIGRSNSGKSTLINALVGVRGLARTGKTPGRTQMINFFSVMDRWAVADLPGYGFSKSPQRIAKHWQHVISAYLSGRPVTTFLFLIDARRQIDAKDKQLLEQISSQVPPLIVMTKADKLPRKQLRDAMQALENTLKDEGLSYEELMAVSAMKGTGIERLRSLIFQH